MITRPQTARMAGMWPQPPHFQAPKITCISLMKLANPGRPADAMAAITKHVPAKGMIRMRPPSSSTIRVWVWS